MPDNKSLITQDDKVFAALSYLWILVLVPLLIKRDREFVQYHARQGLVLFIVELVLSVVSMIPILGWIVGFLGWIAVIILSVLGIVAALAGRYWEMPILSSYAKKINL
jgi:uncharacterized membrane protein